MSNQQSIVISGDLGSGKSTISEQVAKRLGIRKVSMGDIMREMARSRGMSTLQLNLDAEHDETVDSQIDEFQKEIAKTKEQLIVDSRLSWFFFADAFKVHLIVDPAVAAQRAVSRPSSEVEAYSSPEEARERLRTRSESERSRFLRRYGADKARLRNYDLVCDTTRASQEEIAGAIIAAFDGTLKNKLVSYSHPLLLMDPNRIYPTEGIRSLRGLWDTDRDFVVGVDQAGPAQLEPISVGYANPYFYALDGHRRLSAAIQNGFRLITAMLAADGDEEVVGGLSSDEYFRSEISLSKIYDWEAAHNIELELPSFLRP